MTEAQLIWVAIIMVHSVYWNEARVTFMRQGQPFWAAWAMGLVCATALVLVVCGMVLGITAGWEWWHRA